MPRARAPGPGPRRGPLSLSGSESQAQVVTELTLKHWQVKVQEFRQAFIKGQLPVIPNIVL